METETTFDLNLAIQRWRENLSRSAAFRIENLNELESHLRDSMDRLRGRELSEEEAFLIATRRIGNTQRLEQEFGKVNGAAVWFDRWLWGLVAFQLWALISSTSGLLLSVVIEGLSWFNEILPGFGLHKIEGDWVQTGLVLGFSPLATAIAVVLIWRYFIWPKRRGAAVLQRLLRQPGAFAFTLFLLCIGSQIAAVWALQIWYYPNAYHAAYRGYQSSTIHSLLYQLPLPASWAGLTYFAARKRLRAGLA